MTYVRPFVTSRFTAYRGDSRVRNLSLAVRLVDDYTNRPPSGSFRVLLKERRPEEERGQEPVRNLSGHYCFLDVPAGAYTLLVEPAPGARFYHLRPAPGGSWSDVLERAANLPLPNPLDPVVELRLTPSSGFPFLPNATLVRGRVFKALNPAPGAVVRATFQQAQPAPLNPGATGPATVESRADPAGYYALFFRAPSPTEQNVQVTAVAQGQQSAPAAIREGRVTSNIDITVL